jgi:hypothetical protein
VPRYAFTDHTSLATPTYSEEATLKLVALVLVTSWFMATTAEATCNIVNGTSYGDCTGVNVNREKEPYSVVNGFKVVSGMTEGATVVSGGSLVVTGIASEVKVEKGARLTVTGIVSTIRNDSGTVEITGTVDTLFQSAGATVIAGIVHSVQGNGGEITRRPGSVVGGAPTEQ